MIGALRSRPATTAKLINPTDQHPGASRDQQWNATGSKARGSATETRQTRDQQGSNIHRHIRNRAYALTHSEALLPHYRLPRR